MNKTDKSDKKFNLRIPTELYTTFQVKCTAEGISVADAIKQFIAGENNKDSWREKCQISNTVTHGWEVIWRPDGNTNYEEYRLSSEIRVVGWIATSSTPFASTVFGTREFAVDTLAKAAPPPGVKASLITDWRKLVHVRNNTTVSDLNTKLLLQWHHNNKWYVLIPHLDTWVDESQMIGRENGTCLYQSNLFPIYYNSYEQIAEKLKTAPNPPGAA